MALNGLVPWPSPAALRHRGDTGAAASVGARGNGTYLFVYGAADSVVGVGRLTVHTTGAGSG
jgi:hypothetical protein